METQHRVANELFTKRQLTTFAEMLKCNYIFAHVTIAQLNKYWQL